MEKKSSKYFSSFLCFFCFSKRHQVLIFECKRREKIEDNIRPSQMRKLDMQIRWHCKQFQPKHQISYMRIKVHRSQWQTKKNKKKYWAYLRKDINVTSSDHRSLSLRCPSPSPPLTPPSIIPHLSAITKISFCLKFLLSNTCRSICLFIEIYDIKIWMARKKYRIIYLWIIAYIFFQQFK